MAITLGSEIALALHADRNVSYAEIEEALTDSEFADYTIFRSLDNDGGTDLQIFVRTHDGSGLPATDTMTRLTDAITTIAEANGSSTGA